MLGRSYRASPHGGDIVSYCAALHETLSYFINYFGQFCVCVKFKCKPKVKESLILQLDSKYCTYFTVSRLLRHCYTMKVQSLGVRPYCKKTKVTKRLHENLVLWGPHRRKFHATKY